MRARARIGALCAAACLTLAAAGCGASGSEGVNDGTLPAPDITPPSGSTVLAGNTPSSGTSTGTTGATGTTGTTGPAGSSSSSAGSSGTDTSGAGTDTSGSSTDTSGGTTT